ncbi:MAG: hypothetical protein KDA25_11375, partial [Phycisphaerales bacterium]|nr:hypothetical protein [Phycisphaerales bacterium]
MTRSQLAVAIATVLSLCRLGATTPTAESLTDADVGAAMQAIVDELARRKAPDTYWDPPVWIKLDDGEPSQGGGYTALVALALQHAGVSYQSDLLRDVIEHLKTVPLRGTYAIATRAMVWANLPDAFRPQLDADVKWLTEAFSRKSGGWEYEARPQSAILDNSVTLFGALALWHASRRGVTIDDQVWRRMEQRFVATQNADGGWSYRPPDARSTGSMTTAGLTALHIVEDALHGPLFARVVEGYDSPSRRAQRAALAWLDSTFTTDRNPGSDMYDFYYQWGLERVALAGGRRTFGGRDWYREGAAELMRRVLDDDPDTGGYRVRATVNDIFGDSPMRNEQLAFALMFLARGRVPIVINKLQFDGAWNNRPRDVGNFTDWLGRESERELNWQVVRLGSDPTTWLNASMLYIASHEAPPFIADHERALDAYVRESRTMLAKRRAGRLPKDAAPPTRPDVPALDALRTYVELGGQIVAINEQGGRSFARLIELMGSAMYPQYDWQEAPPDHPAYGLVWPADGALPRLQLLSNGVRDLIVLADREDLAASFQERSMRRASAWTTLANLVFIGSEKSRLSPRLHETNPLTSPTREQVSAGTI